MTTIDTAIRPSARPAAKRTLESLTVRQRIFALFLEHLRNPKHSHLPLLITGPSGSGKTYILRQLRELTGQPHTGEPEPEQGNGRLSADSQSDRAVVRATAYQTFDLLPWRYRRPADPLFGQIMLRNQLAAAGARFAFFDFACLLYFYKTGQLTPERIRQLYHIKECGYLFGLAELFYKLPAQDIPAAFFNLTSRTYREHFTPYMMHRGSTPESCRDLMRLQAETALLQQLSHLFADEVKTAVAAHYGPQQVILFFDAVEHLLPQASESPAHHGFDSWLRTIVLKLKQFPGISLILAGRRHPGWRDASPAQAEGDHFDVFDLPLLNEYEAEELLAGRGVTTPWLIRDIKPWAETGSGKFAPLNLQIAADIWQLQNSQENGRKEKESEEFFRILPKQKKDQLRFLIKKLFQTLPRDQALILLTGASARLLTSAQYLVLTQALYLEPSETVYRQLEELHALHQVDEVPGGALLYPELLLNTIQEYGNQVVRKGHQVLRAYMQERARKGDETAAMLRIYHQNRLSWEAGLLEWFAAFRDALRERRWGFLRQLILLTGSLRVESAYWQARMELQLGDYFRQLGDAGQALAYYKSALAGFDRYLAESDEDLDAVLARALCMQRQGEVESRRGEMGQAERCFQKACGVFVDLQSKRPHEPKIACQFAKLLQAQAAGLRLQGQEAKAVSVLERAAAVLRDAAASAPGEQKIVQGQIEVLLDLADLFREQPSRVQDVLPMYNTAVELSNQLLQHDENDYNYTLKCRALTALGQLQLELGELEAAESKFQTALVNYDSAIRFNPRILENYIHKAKIHVDIALVKIRTHSMEESQAYLKSAARTSAELNRMLPDDSRAGALRAFVAFASGMLSFRENQTSAALQAFEESAATLRYLHLIDPDNPLHANNLALVELALGTMHLDRASYAKARAHLETAGGLLQQALDSPAAPASCISNMVLAKTCQAVLAGLTSDHETARSAFEDAKTWCAKLEGGRSPRNQEHFAIALCYHRIADYQALLGEDKIALQYYAEARARYAHCDATIASMLAHQQCEFLIDSGEFLTRNQPADENESDLDRAIAFSKSILASLRDDSWAQELLSLACMRLALQHLHAGAFEEASQWCESARQTLQKLVEKRPENLSARNLFGLTYCASGEIYEKTSRYQDAMEQYTRAISLFQELCGETPGDLHFQCNAGYALLKQGSLRFLLQDYTAAQKCYQDAIECLEHALQQSPLHPVVHSHYIYALLSLGTLFTATEQHPEAFQCYDRASESLQKILRVAPNHTRLQNLRVLLLSRVGDLQFSMQEHAKALDSYSQALEALHQANRIDIGDRVLLSNLGNVYQKQAKCLHALQQPGQAEKAYQQAIDVYNKLGSELGYDFETLYNEGLGHLQLAFLQFSENHAGKAAKHFETAVQLFEQAAVVVPHHPRIFQKIGDACLSLGQMRKTANHLDNAADYLQKAVEAYSQALEQRPDDQLCLMNRGMALLQFGVLQTQAGQSSQARWCLGQAVKDFTLALSADQTDLTLMKSLGEAHASLGDLHYNASEFTEAQSSYNAAIAVYDSVLESNPDAYEFLYYKAVALANLAGGHIALQDSRSAVTCYKQAIALYRHVIAAQPTFENAQHNLGLTLTSLGNLHAMLGASTEAIQHFREAAKQFRLEISRRGDDGSIYLDKGLAEMNLAEVLAAISRPAEARSSYEEALHSFEAAARLLPEDIAGRYNIGLACAGLGALDLGQTQLTAAIEMYNKAIAAYNQVLALAPSNIDAMYNKGVSFLTLGQIHYALSHFDSAKSFFADALQLLREAHAIAPTDMQIREAGIKAQELLRDLERYQPQKSR